MCVPLLLKHSLEAARAYMLLLSRSVVHAHVQITVVGALGDAVYDGSIYTKGGHSVGRVVDGYFRLSPAAAPPPRARSAGCVVCVLSRALRPSQLAAGERNMTLYAPGSSFQRLPLRRAPFIGSFRSPLHPGCTTRRPSPTPGPPSAERSNGFQYTTNGHVLCAKRRQEDTKTPPPRPQP